MLAKLVIDGQDVGLRQFIVPLNDGTSMCQGVTSRCENVILYLSRDLLLNIQIFSLLPKRTGRHVLDHCLTLFNHVKLPRHALLGELDSDPRRAFTESTTRVAVGSLCLSLVSIPALSFTAHIAGRYSLLRKVVNPAGQLVPIWSFRTQQLPILQGLAQLAVARAYSTEVTSLFRCSLAKQPVDERLLVGIAVSVKATLLARLLQFLSAMTERCGAQGLFEENTLIGLQVYKTNVGFNEYLHLLTLFPKNEIKGAVIAEGDVLTVSISKLLLRSCDFS